MIAEAVVFDLVKLTTGGSLRSLRQAWMDGLTGVQHRTHVVPTCCAENCLTNQVIDFNGEPAGTRTQDPVIKSHVLYRLSYGLGAPLLTEKL
jgi:hypothetical protein